jgi:hypothetical protein
MRRALTSSLAAPEHEFRPLDYPVTEIRVELKERIVSHLHLADVFLLDLAIRKQGRLATFDRRIGNLVPSGSSHTGALEILPID